MQHGCDNCKVSPVQTNPVFMGYPQCIKSLETELNKEGEEDYGKVLSMKRRTEEARYV